MKNIFLTFLLFISDQTLGMIVESSLDVSAAIVGFSTNDELLANNEMLCKTSISEGSDPNSEVKNASNHSLSDFAEVRSEVLENGKSDKEIKISYGDKIPAYNMDESTTWKVVGDNFQSSGKGQSLFDVEFKNPGEYVVSFVEDLKHNKSSCSHSHEPLKNIKLFVSSVSFKFDFENITFSNPIVVFEDTKDITIEVPIVVELFDDKQTNFNYNTIYTAGIGTNIKATLLNDNFVLKNEKILLTFKLSGMLSKPGYLIFDFLDYNGNIVSYNYPTFIK